MNETTKTSKIYKALVIVFSIALVGVTGFFLYQFYSLQALPPQLVIPISCAIVLFVLILVICWNHFQHSLFSKILLSVLNIGCLIIFSVGNLYLNKTHDTLTTITHQATEVTNTVSLLVKADSSYSSIHDLADIQVGRLKSIDSLGTTKMLSDLTKQYGVDTETLLPFKLVDFDSVESEVKALYDNEVQAIILNDRYKANVAEIEQYANFANETRSIYQITYVTKVDNSPIKVQEITKNPFNILISGNDTYGDVGELSRSDVNMVVTVNPTTKTVLLTSIPRDSYVDVYCDEQDACALGQKDKITHTGMYGINTTKQTVEKLLGITINYTFRANFSSVMDIVDAIGGIDVEIPEGMAVETFYANHTLEGVHEGMNHLEGERALAFARERYAYIDGDNQRVRNQQTVLKAIIAKATSPEIITNYASLLDAFQGAFDTTLSKDEITSLIKYQIQENPQWKFESYQLTGEGDQLFSPELGSTAYVTLVDPTSITMAHDKIEAVLHGKSADSITEPVSDFTSNEGYVPSSSSSDGLQEDYYDPYSGIQSYPDYTENNTYYDPSYYDQPIDEPVTQPEEEPLPGVEEIPSE